MLAIEMELVRGTRVGPSTFVHRMDGFEHRAQDMTPAFADIHKSFLKTERGLFASRGGATGWQPLTAAYARRKARRGLDARVERATGALYAALTTGSGPGAVTRISRDSAEFGTNLERAVYAHRGSGRRRRRLVVADRLRRRRWEAILRHYLVEGP